MFKLWILLKSWKLLLRHTRQNCELPLFEFNFLLDFYVDIVLTKEKANQVNEIRLSLMHWLYLDSTCSTETGQTALDSGWAAWSKVKITCWSHLSGSEALWVILPNPMCGKWEKNFLQWITTLDTSFSECLRLRYRLGRIRFSSTAIGTPRNTSFRWNFALFALKVRFLEGGDTSLILFKVKFVYVWKPYKDKCNVRLPSGVTVLNCGYHRLQQKVVDAPSWTIFCQWFSKTLHSSVLWENVAWSCMIYPYCLHSFISIIPNGHEVNIRQLIR